MEDVVNAVQAQARTATLVVVGPPERLEEAVTVLSAADAAGSLRSVLMPTEAGPTPSAERRDGVLAVEPVRPEFLNNAIASLRLSSLPTVIWWRGGPPERLDGVAALADRIVLDAIDSGPLWARAATLFSRTAITDLRWARLTRWRTAMAHLFDLPQVREAVPAFTRLAISGDDRSQCALFAGWLRASLDSRERLATELEPGSGGSMLHVSLEAPDLQVDLKLRSGGACIAGEARSRGETCASRVVSAGDQRLATLLSEELRIRSRDLAFEAAIREL